MGHNNKQAVNLSQAWPPTPHTVAMRIISEAHRYSEFRLTPEGHSSGEAPRLSDDLNNICRFRVRLMDVALREVLDNHLDAKTWKRGYGYGFHYVSLIPARMAGYYPDFETLGLYLMRCADLQKSDLEHYSVNLVGNRSRAFFGPGAEVMNMGMMLTDRYLKSNTASTSEEKRKRGLILDLAVEVIERHMDWIMHGGLKVKLSPRAIEVVCNHAPAEWVHWNKGALNYATPQAYRSTMWDRTSLRGMTDAGWDRWCALYRGELVCTDQQDKPATPQPRSQSGPAPR